MSAAIRITTAEELLRMPDDGFRYDLIEGELRQMTPAGFAHGFIISELHGRLWNYISERKLGVLTGAETGYIVKRNPDTVLAADIAFVRQARVETLGYPNEYFPEAPALAVEVVSPHGTIEEVDDKMRYWLGAGAELVWVPYPRGRTVTVYRSLKDIRVLTSNDVLSGDDVVPGFSVRVGELFAALDR